jgi:hypothetical protein
MNRIVVLLPPLVLLLIRAPLAMNYSYRSDSIGWSFAAWLAGR